ncbi:hypothetical protein PT274_03390 [Leuconostocaceae bacterium ESL0958]|nr:hypothetical protein [Leuconostocaceae bacterium ESL0958]
MGKFNQFVDEFEKQKAVSETTGLKNEGRKLVANEPTNRPRSVRVKAHSYEQLLELKVKTDRSLLSLLDEAVQNFYELKEMG